MGKKINNYTNKNVKYLRIKKKLSQEKLSNDLNINQATLAKWESNSRKITLDWAITISEYFDVFIGDFISQDLSKENDSK